MKLSRSRILLYVHESVNCTRLRRVFNHHFDLEVVYSRDQFLSKANNNSIDLGVLCYCYANEQDLYEVVGLKNKTSHIPVLVSTKFPNPEFIAKGARLGLEHFLLCEMPVDRIKSSIEMCIETHGMLLFVNNLVLQKAQSPYTSKIVRAIHHALPGHPDVSELAELLDISQRWLQVLIRRIFGLTYTKLIRKITIYQALNLMKNTNLDNTEIALKLRYSEENSLYRIFNKELGISPSSARKQLIHKNPEELLQ